MEQWAQMWVDQLNDHCTTTTEYRLKWAPHHISPSTFEQGKFCDIQTEELCRECRAILGAYQAMSPKWEKFIEKAKV